ncbi:Imm1 family immunity protein [Umezawaea sp. Da 62-37]|uniref:Imm1 family immunity protein n=1 Tax=Umezawaea sp. Da 62-37 TaxID=3075927 RepID=UPI0037DC3F64
MGLLPPRGRHAGATRETLSWDEVTLGHTPGVVRRPVSTSPIHVDFPAVAKGAAPSSTGPRGIGRVVHGLGRWRITTVPDRTGLSAGAAVPSDIVRRILVEFRMTGARPVCAAWRKSDAP